LSRCPAKYESSWKMRAVRLLLLTMLFASLTGEAIAQSPASNRTRRNVRLYARLLAMTDSRIFDRALVDSALAGSWAPLRAAAVLAVGQVGPSHGMPGAARLRELLTDRDVAVASNAAYALGLLRDSTPVAVSALGAALGGPPRVAREAAWALGEIGAMARNTIVSALTTPGTDEARTIQLLLAAAKLRPVPVAEIGRYLAAESRPSVLWAAAYAIARPRAPAGARVLISAAELPLLSRPSGSELQAIANTAPSARPQTAEVYVAPVAGRQRARAEIARGLSKAAAGDSLADRAIPVLSRLALDPHPHVRINAVRSLATFGPRSRDLVVAATRDPDANARIAAAQSLNTVLDSNVVSWKPLWSADTSMMYRSSLLASAAHAGATLPEFVTWQGHPDWRCRAAALHAAGDLPNSRLGRQVGFEMTSDTDARVRAAAYSVIAGNDSVLSAPAREALLRGLSDPDYIVRATVIGSLGRRANAADAPFILNAYQRSSRDSSNDARIAAIQYLAAAWKRDSAAFSPTLRTNLSRLHPSPDPLVRSEAAGASIFRGWESTSGTPRPIEWYERLVRTYVLPALAGERQRATIRTPKGDIVLDLYGADAPVTVDNFLTLARRGYYRGTSFHRVVPNFVAQDGDPRDDGNGGPGYAIRDEMNPRRYDRGALGMALSGPDTGGSQYFITHSPQPHLDGHYTVFGRVVRGFRALDAIVQGDQILAVVPR
jgi:cyclophilin family peptidyl-prolyl cis-trans isomerase/HEAT repeat protein